MMSVFICEQRPPDYFNDDYDSEDGCLDPLEALFICVAIFCAGIIAFMNGFRVIWKKRLLENTPTSKARSVAMGMVEVQGTITPFQEITVAPFSGTQCVWFRYELEEEREQRDKDGNIEKYWVDIDTAAWRVPFFVQDDTGKILVDSTNCAVETAIDRRGVRILESELPQYVIDRVKGKLGRGRPLRYTERFIKIGEPLFVLGFAGDNPFVAETTADDAVKDKMIRFQEGYPFFITDKSEKEVLKGLQSGPSWIVGGAVVSGVGLLAFLDVLINYFLKK